MSQEETRRIAQEFLRRMGTGATPEAIAELSSPDLDFYIPGDVTSLPWIGRRAGRSALADFVAGTRSLIEPLRFDVQDLLVSDTRAVILGELTSRLKRNGQVVDQPFAIVLTVSGGHITRFLMLEDSHAVSRAAQALAPAASP
jgi:uncharacterized protein